jgi:hypothetical protein
MRKSKTKRPNACAPSEHLPHHRIGRPNPPPLAHSAPTRRFWMPLGLGAHKPEAGCQAASRCGCARRVSCRSTNPTSALNRTSYPFIRSPHPCFRACALRRFALQGNERPGVTTHRVSTHIGTRTPHVSLTNTEQLLGVKKRFSNIGLSGMHQGAFVKQNRVRAPPPPPPVPAPPVLGFLVVRSAEGLLPSTRN